jgi:hypothetical protein
VGRGLGAARPVPLVRMAVGGSGNRLVPLTGFALGHISSRVGQRRDGGADQVQLQERNIDLG